MTSTTISDDAGRASRVCDATLGLIRQHDPSATISSVVPTENGGLFIKVGTTTDAACVQSHVAKALPLCNVVILDKEISSNAEIGILVPGSDDMAILAQEVVSSTATVRLFSWGSQIMLCVVVIAVMANMISHTPTQSD